MYTCTIYIYRVVLTLAILQTSEDGPGIGAIEALANVGVCGAEKYYIYLKNIYTNHRFIYSWTRLNALNC